MRKLVPQKLTTAPRQMRDFNELFDLREDLNDPDLLIQAKALVLCSLPWKPIPEDRLPLEGKIGDQTIHVTFTATHPDYPLPFGADRAVLAWISTLAYQHGHVEFDTLRGFFDTFRIPDCGTNYTRFKARIDRLSHLAINIHTTAGAVYVENAPPVARAIYPTTPKEARRMLVDEDQGQQLLIPQRYGFQLGREFHQYLRSNPVPLPLELMRLFHAEPKAWDFTQLVLWRCYAAKRPSVVPWKALIEQLGSQDKDEKQLKRSLVKILDRLRVVYPDFPACFRRGFRGLRVAPYKPPQRLNP